MRTSLFVVSVLIYMLSGCVRHTDSATYRVIEIDSVPSRVIYMGDVTYNTVLNQISKKEAISFFGQDYFTSNTSKVTIKDTMVDAYVLDNFDFPKTILSFQSDTSVPYYSVIDTNLFVIVNDKTLTLETDSSVLSRAQLKDYQYLILLLNTDISILGNRIFLPYQDGRYVNWQTSSGISEIYQHGKPLVYIEINDFKNVQVFGAYPDEYIDNEFFGYNMNPKISPFGDGYVLSYPAARNLVIVSSYGEKIREVDAASLDQIPYNQINREDFMIISKVSKWLQTTPIYGEFIYNSYRNEYYRLYQTPGKKGRIDTYNLIRLNSDLKIIGEFLISGEIYNPYVFLSTPNGFAIQLFPDSTNLDLTRNSIREFYLN